ncbi:MAG: helix-turn-helix domain-containing protein [Chloroflexota bacterium]|nr:helix-turn-helix domain-containing protein [Chloroflexota bacterium]
MAAETRAPVEQEAHSPKEVATILGVHYETVIRWVTSGQLPSFRIGNVRRVRRDVLDELMGKAGGRARERYPEPAEPVGPVEEWG